MTFFARLERVNATGQRPSITAVDARFQATRPTSAILRRLTRLAAAIGMASAAIPALAATPSADDGFSPAANAQVVSSAIQPDGKILVGGYFTTVQSPGAGGLFTRNRIARLMPDGSVDPSFDPNANGPVTAMYLQPDNKIVIGGYFTQLAPNGGPAVARNHVARLNSDGTVDPSFDPNVSGSIPSIVYIAAITEDSSGRILIGGEFTAVAPNGASTQTTAKRIARFNGDGTFDASFSPGFGNVVRSIVVQTNGDIVVGGGFTTATSSGSSTSIARNRIARLSSAGVVDASYDPNADNLVTSMALQVDGKVVVAGNFTTLTSAATSRSRIARLNTDGTLDSTFQAGVNAAVEKIKVTLDGKIIASGAFRAALSTGSSVATRADYIVRFFADGTIDSSFYPGPSYTISTFALQSDGKLFVGGSFTDFVPAAIGTTVPRRFMARLNEDGSLDASLNPSVNSRISVMVEQSDKSVLLGGSFGSIGGITRHSIARISATGVVDLAFDPGIEGQVNAIAVQSDGKILVGGSFQYVISAGASDAVARNYLVRLNSDGTIDTSFNPNPNSTIYTIVVQSDGKILIGGLFSTLQPEGDTDATSKGYLARLNGDGTIDTTFTTVANSAVSSIALESDSRILIAGSFTALSENSTTSITAPYIARLGTDGKVVTDFSPVLNSYVTALKVLSSGKILLGGRFTAIRSAGAAATDYTTRRGMAMLGSDGTVDTSFDPEPNDEVDSIALQDDGKILIAGRFTALYPNDPGATGDPTYRNYYARLNSDGTIDSAYDPHPNLPVSVVLQQSGGGALISGSFNSFQPLGSIAIQLDTGLARILPDGSIDTAFKPSVGGAAGEVRALSYQKDGSIYVGGSFGRFAGSLQGNLMHMRSEGIADFKFLASPNGPVNALLPRSSVADPTTLNQRVGWLEPTGLLRTGLYIDPNLLIDGSIFTLARQTIGANAGKILIGGTITVSNASTTVSYLARLNPDGSLDSTFNPQVSGGSVYKVVVRSSDDAILVLGAITAVGSTTRNGIALLDANGNLDASFDPNATGAVLCGAFLSDGRVVIGGQFSSLMPNGSTTSVAIARLARLSTNGEVDTSFNVGPNAEVDALTVQPSDGKILIGGLFASVAPNGASTATTRNGIARINTDGTLDSAFDPNLNGQAGAIRVQSDGKIVIGGTFTTITPNGATDAITANRLARLNTDGTVDSTFSASANGAVVSLEIQPTDGAFVIAGEFTTVDGVIRNKIARITSTGALDSSFNPNALGAVNSVILMADNSIVAGGSFTSLNVGSVLLAGGEFTQVNQTDTPYLTLFSSDGNPLIGSVPYPDAPVHALASYADGRVLVAGEFTEMGGTARNHAARLLADNSLDDTFAPNVSGTVKSAAIQPDNRAVIGGTFDTVDGVSHPNLARVNENGAVDATFTGSTDGEVRALVVQPDGKILVGGSFNMLSGTPRTGLGRVNADGSIDSTFAPGLNGPVNSIALQTDGTVLVGGTFTSAGGVARAGFAKLAVANGAVDGSYDAAPNGAVKTIVVSPGGKVVVGGAFTTIGGAARYLFARLTPTTGVSASLIVGSDGSSLLWQRTGAGPEIPYANFEMSTNGRDWSPLGTGVRDNSIPGWRISGLSLPANTYFYARAISLVASNQGGSGSFIETVRAQYIVPSGGTTGGSTEPPEVPPRPSNFLAETYLSANPDLANALAGLPDRLDLAWVDYYTHKMATDTEHLYMSGEGESSVDPKLTNLSARAWIGPGEQSLIMGIVISDGPVKVLVRALGPSLAAYQIPNPVADPAITVYSGNTVIASNDNWGTDPSVTPAVMTEAGTTAMTNALDSAMVITLQPGPYTFVVKGKNGSGVGLGELFLLSGGTGRLTNISARAQVGEGGDILIAGFIRQGVGELLLRGVGPDLAQYGITNYLTDPVISLHKLSTGSTIVANDDWGQIVGAISDKNARAGAVPFPQGSKDSAAYVVLGSGGYTLHVSGAQPGEKGVALVEVFELR